MGGEDGDEPPEKLDAAIVYAPASEVFVEALKKTDKGGRVVLGEIYMTPVERLEYRLLWGERGENCCQRYQERCFRVH